MRPHKQILVFGGSFNPPTLAHEAILYACLALLQFDEVWVMPSGDRQDKHMKVNADQRLQMLQAMRSGTFADDPRLVVTDFELQLPGPTQTSRTIQALAAAYPGSDFSYAFGGDSYCDMPNWPGADEFIQTIRTVVFTEEPLTGIDKSRTLQQHLPAAVQSISSTQVRAVLADKGDAPAWLSPSVSKYIAQHGLYIN